MEGARGVGAFSGVFCYLRLALKPVFTFRCRRDCMVTLQLAP
jgi:hypothetical protein